MISALIGLIGIIIGAIPTYLFMRKKGLAEIDKLHAETDKINAEAEKIRQDLQTGTDPGVKNIRLPKEYTLSFPARRETLGQTQGSILKYMVTNSQGGRWINQATLNAKFEYMKGSELFYRLEYLRFLGFLESQITGQDKNGIDQFSYRLSEEYQKEIGDSYLATP
jgi:hypothetical protein